MTYKMQNNTLTTGVDTTLIAGTSGNDTFNALVDAVTAANSTLTVADQVAGALGNDILNVTVNTKDATATAFPAASVTSVETFNIRAVNGDALGTGSVTANASVFAGVTAVNADRATQGITVTNLATGASAGIIGNGTVVNGALDFSYAAAAGTVGAVGTLNLSGGVKGTNSAVTLTQTADTGNVDTVVVNSTGAANAVKSLDVKGAGAAAATSLTVNAATNADFGTGVTGFAGTAAKITVSGAATAVKLGAIEATTVKTIDASGLTAGGITATLNAAVTSVKGGAGNDAITSATTTAATAVIDAGAGTADKLVLAAGGDVTTALKGAQYTNFEILGLNDSQDVSLVSGITSLELNAMNSKTISKISATQAAAITVAADQATAVTLTLADATGTADAVTLALKSATATTNVNVAGLSVVGVETLNVAATTGTAATSSSVAFAVGGADKLTAINISGTADVALVGTNTAKAVTLVSTTSGIATVSGNFVDASSITTGAGKDVITLGTGFGTYNSGLGDDTFNASAAQLNTGASYNVINGGDGTDTLNIIGGGALTIVDNNLSKISAIEKIVVDTTTTNAQSIQTGGFFDAAFKTVGVNLTTVSTAGTIGIDMTSFTGAATLTTTSTTGAQTIATGTAGGASKVDAAATTGAVTVTTGTGNDTVKITHFGTVATNDAVTTGAGNDSITLVGTATKTVATTITAGAGADTIVLDTAGTSTDTIVIGNTDSGITVATADSVKNFLTTVDTLKLGINGDAAGVGTTNYHEAAAAVTDFAAALSAGNTILATLATNNTGAVEAFAFQWDATNGYLFNDTDGNGTADQVIVLVGLTGAGIAAADIIA